MGRYLAYGEYKDSGEEWLGKVPTHWTVIQIKHLSTVRRGASPRPIDDQKYFDDEGEYAWTRIADVTASDVYLLHAPQKLSNLGSSLSVKLEPESLFLSIAGTVGKPCITGIKACIHDGFVYFPELKIPSKFLFYVFAGEQAYKGLGKFGTQLNLNTDTVGCIKIGCSTNKELEKIVQFLDHETAKIDNLIAKQQQLIKLLKEKRQAVISHAVTKGLNPKAPMRDSGVEWLGEVPEHWTVLQVRRVLPMMEQGRSPECDNRPAEFGEWGVLKTSCVNQAKYHSEENKFLPDELKPFPQYEVKVGDVLMSRASGSIDLIGSVAYVDKTPPKILLSDKIFRLGLSENINGKYFTYLMQSSYMRSNIQISISGAEGMANNITKSSVMGFIFALPSIPDQLEIVNFLAKEIFIFDKLLAKTDKAVKLLQERRTALISAAVTGKIDVRHWQPSSGILPLEAAA